MARLFTDGAESGDLSRWTVANASVTNQGSYKRIGNYAYQLHNQTFSTSASAQLTLADAITEMYFRAAWRLGAWPNNGETILMEWKTAGDTSLGTLRLASTSPAELSVYDAGNNRVTSIPLGWSPGEWHIIELYVKIAGAGTGRFTVKFDGLQVADFTGVTNTNGASIGQLFFYGMHTSTGTDGNDTFLDDMALNDTSGGADNGWIGDGGVLAALVPTGAGNYTDLTASAGNAYACLDEIPHNSDTDYVYDSTADHKSSYAMSDLSGLPAGATIARVWVEVVAKESSADGDKIAALLRSNTTDEQGADHDLSLGYQRFLSADYLTDPQDSAAWTTTKVNALEAGAVVR